MNSENHINNQTEIEKSPQKITKLSSNDIETSMRSIFVNRKGTILNSYMTTVRLIDWFYPYTNLKFKQNVIYKTEKKENIKQLDSTSLPKPAYTYFTGDVIDEEEGYLHSQNNILGTNYILEVNRMVLTIPIVETTAENLAYYGCYLLNNKDIVQMESAYPVGLFEMDIGENYLKHYLLRLGFGNGFYLETHNQPHYYNFIGYHNRYTYENKIKGYLVLGKLIGNNFVVSAFNVPSRKAIYVPPYVYHCDGCLVGRYNVMYSKTDTYATYLLRHKKNIVDINLSSAV